MVQTSFAPQGLAAGNGGASGKSKIWIAPSIKMATRRPDGDRATLPPASKIGLAWARKASLPVAASRTVTSWRVRSAGLNGEIAFTGWLARTVSWASLVPFLLAVSRGQMAVLLS